MDNYLRDYLQRLESGIAKALGTIGGDFCNNRQVNFKMNLEPMKHNLKIVGPGYFAIYLWANIQLLAWDD